MTALAAWMVVWGSEARARLNDLAVLSRLRLNLLVLMAAAVCHPHCDPAGLVQL